MKDKKRRQSLKTRIVVTTLLPVLISFLCLSMVIYFSLADALQDTAESRFLQLSEKYAHSFEAQIAEAMDYLVITASELETQIARGYVDREALQAALFNIFDTYSRLDGSSVYFEPGRYDGLDAAYKDTHYGTAQSGRICWYYYKDQGRTAYLPEGISDDIEFTLPHYTGAKAQNKPIYTDPVTYEIDGRHIPMFTLTYPVRSPEGAFIGAVTVDLFLDDIYTQIQNEAIYDTGYAVIENDNNRILYSPIYAHIGQTRQEAGIDYPLPQQSGDPFFFTGHSLVNGKRSMITVQRVHVDELDSSFYVSVAAPEAEIHAGAYRFMAVFAALGAVVLGGIALLLYYLIGKLTSPLIQVSESVNRIAAGDYDARITGTYGGELDMVKSSVNLMADSIQAYIREADNTLESLKTIFNGLDAYIYVSDPETDEMLFINDRMRQLYGVEDYVSGRTCWQLFREGQSERCAGCANAQLADGQVSQVAWESHHAASNRFFRNIDSYIDWAGGRKAHLQHAVDITEIKRAQESLNRRLGQQALMAAISQSFLQGQDIDLQIAEALRMTGEFMEGAQILFYQAEPDGCTLTCRSEWISPGLGFDSRLGSQWHLDDKLRALIVRMRNGSVDRVLNSQNPVVRAEMAPFRVHFHNYIILPLFVKGKMYGVLDFARTDDAASMSESDIDLAKLVASLLTGGLDRHLLEAQLWQLSSIVESSPQFILYLAENGRIDYVNPAAGAITGYTEAEIIQGGLETLFEAPTVRDLRVRHIPAILENGEDNFEIPLIRRDGERRIMAFSGFTTGAGRGTVGCIASDVTDMRRLERELITARDLAEQGSRAKSDFLSRMSHEMRTPMNAIIGMTTIAQASDDPEKKEYCLSQIDNASRHLLGVINDILDMSKIEADKFTLSAEPFVFGQMLQNVLDVVSFRVREREQTLTVSIDPALPTVMVGDAQRLSQVMTNLLSNAVKFTDDHGDIALRADLAAREDDICTLRIAVQDSGIGISSAQQSKLFHSFEQADGSIARRFGGTGLGLAISRSIVELMGGVIGVQSKLGEGSTFTITVPMVASREEDAGPEREPEALNLAGKTALLAEDVAINREIIISVLEESHLAVECAENGLEAVRMFAQNPGRYDIIFMDMHMPEVDGLEATRRIRALSAPQAKTVPIVAMTANVFQEDIQRCLEAGMDDHVGKPVDFDILFAKLRKYLGSS